MRVSFPSLLALSLVVAAAARRGGVVRPPSAPSSAAPLHPRRSHSLQPWGYPYGWGLDDNPLPAEDPDEVKKMKPVRREVMPKEGRKAAAPKSTPGWLGVMGDPDHRNWDDAMDGLE